MAGTDERAGWSDLGPETQPLLLSLVIPAFNESERLGAGFSRLKVAVARGAIDPATTEFVVVDDGSDDDTSTNAASILSTYPHVKVIRLPENRGKGAAVRAGVGAASGELIAFADADMAIDPSQTPEFVAALVTHDVAIGSRAASGSTVDRPSMRRSAMNRLFNGLVNLLTRLSLDDTQCGFKAFRAPAAKLLFHCSVTERFAFDVEVLSLARKFGFTIAEVPVNWLRVSGSRVRPLADAVSMARDVLRATRVSATAPVVPTLVITLQRGSGEERALRTLVGPTHGILRRSDAEVVVLCPLMDQGEVALLAERIVGAGLRVEPSSVTIQELSAESPLALRQYSDRPDPGPH